MTKNKQFVPLSINEQKQSKWKKIFKIGCLSYLGVVALLIIIGICADPVPEQEKNPQTTVKTEVKTETKTVAKPVIKEVPEPNKRAVDCIGKTPLEYAQKFRIAKWFFEKEDLIGLKHNNTYYKIRNPQYDNLTFGVGANQSDFIIERVGYALGYIEKHEQAEFVSYKLTKYEATTKATKRTNNFWVDKSIPTWSSAPIDYYQTGFDRGHLAPAADMAFSVKTMNESFSMANMSPQHPSFNRGIWMHLEAQVRQFAIDEEEIYVVTGPIFPKEGKPSIGKSSSVTVPEAYYKVVYDLTPPQKMIAFILPNEGSRKTIKDFTVSVDDVEKITGIDFFYKLEDNIENPLESSFNVDDWKWGYNTNYTYSTPKQTKEKNHKDAESLDYWVTYKTGTVHNKSCRWYKDSAGYPTNKPTGRVKNCKRCGGAN